MLDEQRKKEEKKKRDDYKLQAFEDAHQWNLISEENAEKLIFLSNKTGEIRTGLPNALDWVVQDDGYGFPCFANKLNGMVVYEEPRFLDDVDEDIDAQRKYVMQELRLATYMCRDYWENYSKLVSLGDNRQIDVYALQVRNSAKCRHLDSFLIRAKALYQQKSVVDKPISQSVIEELDYASWLAERISEIIERAEIFLSKKKDVKSLTLGKFSSAHKDKVFCRYCTRETKRHLEYCPTCGKPQVFID